MDNDVIKSLADDTDGLLTYEYIANHIDKIQPVVDQLVEHMKLVDRTGQFLVSAARYLNAINAEKYASQISTLIAAAIEKDREHRYLPDLLTIWGADYEADAERLSASDDNFRRIYKRLYPTKF
ncbi:hypothetical protein [uncultured Muribaculum sp.]|jgi:hypothetical protein|uniref:hypothetical protein n=1 Tax=uncultured Muribaculum sp. TaxID=1918613 RepID=UPI00258EFCAC|nr:hypothetical protein [uncultured Muribaculum sp.]